MSYSATQLAEMICFIVSENENENIQAMTMKKTNGKGGPTKVKSTIKDGKNKVGKKGAKKLARMPPPVPYKKEIAPLEYSSLNEMTLEEKCDMIAELSESILEDPSTTFSAGETGDSKIKRLLAVASESNSSENEYTARLAIMSLLAVFQDILPSYRIRLPNAAEMAVKVSKDTKKIWDHERALLHHYQLYLKLLEKTWEQEKDDVSKPLGVTCILALCELLKANPHFNFRSNILAVVIRQMNNRQCEEVGDACCASVQHIFATDTQGEVALEAARLVAKLAKDKQFRIRAAVLRTFVSLPLKVHVDEAEAAKLASAANAKKRKRNKEEADIESEMREGSAEVDKILLARCQSDTLQVVTLTYFRILKSEDLNTDSIAELLPPALEGLAKFAHLINMDTVMDLLGVLKILLKKVDSLPLDAALNCVLTSFQTLQGPGRELKIDQKEYITPLYSQLARLTTGERNSNHTDIALKCLFSAFIKRREYSSVRVAAFMKQLCTVCMHAPVTTSAPLIAFVRQLIHRYPSVHQLLENELDVITSGSYTPEVEDPEHSNPNATSAWELSTLKFHIHPAIAYQASAAASEKMIQLPREGTDRIRSELRNDADELYIELKRHKKRHPLAPKVGQELGKCPPARFISPRVASMNLHRMR